MQRQQLEALLLHLHLQRVHQLILILHRIGLQGIAGLNGLDPLAQVLLHLSAQLEDQLVEGINFALEENGGHSRDRRLVYGIHRTQKPPRSVPSCRDGPVQRH